MGNFLRDCDELLFLGFEIPLQVHNPLSDLIFGCPVVVSNLLFMDKLFLKSLNFVV